MQLWFPTWEATMTPGSALEFLRSEVVKLRFAHVQAKSHITDARVDGTQFLSPDPETGGAVTHRCAGRGSNLWQRQGENYVRISPSLDVGSR